jgi:hypothetical protein
MRICTRRAGTFRDVVTGPLGSACIRRWGLNYASAGGIGCTPMFRLNLLAA